MDHRPSARADRAEVRVADLQATAARVQVIEEMAARNAELRRRLLVQGD